MSTRDIRSFLPEAWTIFVIRIVAKVSRIAHQAMSGYSFEYLRKDNPFDENRNSGPDPQRNLHSGCEENRQALEAKTMNGANPRYFQFRGEDWNDSHASSSFNFDDEKSPSYTPGSDVYSQPDFQNAAPPPAPKPKKFFKSRDSSNSSTPDGAPLRKFDLSTLYGPKNKLQKKPPKRRMPPPATKSAGRKVDPDPPPPPPFLHRSPPAAMLSPPPSEPERTSLKIVMKKTASGFHVETNPTSPPSIPPPKSKKERLLRAHERVNYEPPPPVAPPVAPPVDLIDELFPEQPPSVSSRSARYARRARTPKTYSESEDSQPAMSPPLVLEEPRQRSKSPRAARKRANSGRKRQKRGGGSAGGATRPKKASPPPAVTWESLLGADAIVVVPESPAEEERDDKEEQEFVPEEESLSSKIEPPDEPQVAPEPPERMFSEPMEESPDIEAALEALHSDSVPEVPSVPVQQEPHVVSQPVEVPENARATRRNRRGLNDIVMSLSATTVPPVVVPEPPSLPTSVIRPRRGRLPKMYYNEEVVPVEEPSPVVSSELPPQSLPSPIRAMDEEPKDLTRKTESKPPAPAVSSEFVSLKIKFHRGKLEHTGDLGGVPAASEPVAQPEPTLPTMQEDLPEEITPLKSDSEPPLSLVSNPEPTTVRPRRGRQPKVKELVDFHADSEPMPASDRLLERIQETEESFSAPVTEEDFEPLRQADRVVQVQPNRSSSAVPAKKPRIFFSKASSNATKRASYKHKWAADGDEEAAKLGKNASVAGDSKSRPYDDFDVDFDSGFSDGVPKLRKVATAPARQCGPDVFGEENKEIVSIKCNREEKKFFTVVKNVRAGYQIQEIAEFQDFQDDVDYILESLKDTNPIGVRCLSAISLASKCMMPAFRMHLRAHGTVANFFGALQDAPSDPSLSLCTAMIFFVLAQDRLNMDLDGSSLNLMLRLIESNSGGEGAEFKETKLDSRELEKHRQKAREICSELQAHGHANTLDLDRITPEHLAIETLLSLTSRRAGEWFKEELRELGGLDHIVNSVAECLSVLPEARPQNQIHTTPAIQWNAKSIEKLKRAERCLRVFQNVTTQNEDNQKYLLSYQDGRLYKCVMKLFHLAANELPVYDVKAMAVRDSLAASMLATLLSSMKVLLVLGGDIFSARGDEHPAEILGKHQQLFELCLRCLFHLRKNVTEAIKSEFLILALGILLHLVEKSQNNRIRLLGLKVDDGYNIGGTNAMEALARLFLTCDTNAKEVEVVTENIIDEMGEAHEKRKTEVDKKKSEEQFEETINDLVAKAGKHMEETVIGANIALLLAHCIWDNDEREEALRNLLPENNFAPMIGLVEKYYNFVKLTATSGNTGTNAMQMIDKSLKYLKKRDELKANPERRDTSVADQLNSSWSFDDSMSMPLPDADESFSADDSSNVGENEFMFSPA